MKHRDLLRLLASSGLAVFLAIAWVRASEPVGGDAKKPETKDPTQGVNIATKPVTETSPAAQAVLEAVRDAYAKLTSLQLAGKYQVDFDVDGEIVNKSVGFNASFSAPNRFRHELKDNSLVGSTGEKIFAFDTVHNTYMIADSPKERALFGDIPEPMSQIIDQQNPALLLALVTDAGAQLLEGVAKADKVNDVKIDNAAYTALKLITPNVGEVELLLDPQTNLVRRYTADMVKAIENRGRQNVHKATISIDYTDVKSNTPIAADQFAWSPPQDAKEAPAIESSDEGGKALEGKPAPTFTLKTLDGKEVKLAGLKGKVVILDFWTTWCVTCRQTLPHLDELAEAMKDKGVLAYAINIQEEKADIEKFIDKTKLRTTVLPDADGKVSISYGVQPLPQTVVIGKDGKVRKVFTGTPEGLDEAVRAAAAE